MLVYYCCVYILPQLWAFLCAGITMLGHGLSACLTTLTIAYQHALPIIFGFCGNCATTLTALLSAITTCIGLAYQAMLSGCFAIISACTPLINTLLPVMGNPYTLPILIITCVICMLLAQAYHNTLNPRPRWNPIEHSPENIMPEPRFHSEIATHNNRHFNPASNIPACHAEHSLIRRGQYTAMNIAARQPARHTETHIPRTRHHLRNAALTQPSGTSICNGRSQSHIPTANPLSTDNASSITTIATRINPSPDQYPQSAILCCPHQPDTLPYAVATTIL